MRPTRRSLLWSAGGVLAACAPGTGSVDRVLPGGADTGDTGFPDGTGSTGLPPGWTGEPGPEPDPWTPDGDEDPAQFPWGVQSGDAIFDGAIVSVRTFESEVMLVVVQGTEDGWVEVLTLPNLMPVDKVVQVELTELIPDTTYAFCFYATDGVRRSSPGRFRTALYPGGNRLVRFGATSCLGGNEPWESLTQASGELFDFFVLLGDTVYADSGWEEPDFEGDWETALAVQGMRDLAQSTSFLATWDDHEVEDNWSLTEPGMPEQALEALDSFRRAIPQRVGSQGSGLWRTVHWGDTVQVFVLDCRGERLNGDYISVEQMEWLKQGLLDSTAQFKIVCNSVPITDMDDVYFGVAAEDRWDGHPVQKAEILDHIADNAISGVLWIAGDFHWGALSTIGRPGDPWDDQREVFCGPGGSGINPIVFLLQPNDHYELVIKEHNYTAFECDPDAGTIRVAFIADDGSVIGLSTIAF